MNACFKKFVYRKKYFCLNTNKKNTQKEKLVKKYLEFKLNYENELIKDLPNPGISVVLF